MERTLTSIIIFCLLLMNILTLAACHSSEHPGSSKQVAGRQTAEMRLASLGAAETTFRTLLAKRRYTTLSDLQTTVSGGVPLISAGDVTATGWAFSDAESATATTFGLRAVPTSDNSRDLSFAIFEDQVLRTCPRTGPWTRSCQTVDP